MASNSAHIHHAASAVAASPRFSEQTRAMALPFSHALPSETPDGCVDVDAFRSGMRSVAGAVNVLTTVWQGERFGLTATAVCSLSAEPPRLLACVNQRGATFSAMQQSRVLAVNVLSVQHEAIAMRFAGMLGGDQDRFAAGQWRQGSLDDVPVLADASAVFECRVSEVIDSVSHAIFVCDIFNVATQAGARPLIYCDGAFRGLTNAAA